MYTTLISTEELLENYARPDWVLIDCRFMLTGGGTRETGRSDYRESHIPGAFYAHTDDDLSSEIIPGKTSRHPLPGIDETAALFSGWGIDETVQVVVYDDNIGAIAGRLWWMLLWMGHENVAVLEGGWDLWKKKGYPADNKTPLAADRTFKPRPRHDLLVGADQVRKISDSGSGLLIDSRAAERYRGEVEHLDPVAGHIPGAFNRPFKENLNEDGMFLDRDSLKEAFASVLGETEPGEAVFYCGSGITACHNLLAMKHAGLGDAKLFAGSWSYWITDPERPVERSQAEE